MAEQEPSAGDGSEPDLHARIQSRIAQRRASGADTPESGRVARSGSAQVSDRAADGRASGVRAAGARASGVRAAGARASGGRTTGARTAGARRASARRASARRASARQSPSLANRLLRALMFLLAVVVTVVVLRSFVVASYYIPSASMETTLHGCPHCQPDLVVVDKLSYRFSSVARSDVVVFDRPPLAPPEDTELIKRVIGLPGETISGHGGRVFVGDKALSEPYVNPACGGTGDFPPVKVPAGEYFMMGDNRCDSLDSRVFGVIPGSSIVGRSVAVTWPVKHLRWL